MRWSQVVVVALLFAGCSAYNELSPEPPITPLERGYIELKADQEAFVLEKDAKYYVQFPGPIRDQFLLVLTTPEKWALGSYLTKTFGDDDVPVVKIPDEAALNDSLFVYALEPRVPVFTWVIDTVKMDLYAFAALPVCPPVALHIREQVYGFPEAAGREQDGPLGVQQHHALHELRRI